MKEDEDIPLRAVNVQPYGSRGIMPANPEDCPYRGESACISSSGESFCGGLYEEDYDADADPGQATIRCMEEQTLDEETWNAIHPDGQTIDNPRRFLERGML
jgi:hypothetical protein